MSQKSRIVDGFTPPMHEMYADAETMIAFIVAMSPHATSSMMISPMSQQRGAPAAWSLHAESADEK